MYIKIPCYVKYIGYSVKYMQKELENPKKGYYICGMEIIS